MDSKRKNFNQDTIPSQVIVWYKDATWRMIVSCFKLTLDVIIFQCCTAVRRLLHLRSIALLGNYASAYNNNHRTKRHRYHNPTRQKIKSTSSQFTGKQNQCLILQNTSHFQNVKIQGRGLRYHKVAQYHLVEFVVLNRKYILH